MKISKEHWNGLALTLKNRLLAKYDPSVLVPPFENRSSLNISHKGFYILVIDSSKQKIARTGFLKDGESNVFDSGVKVIDALHTELEADKVPHKKLLTATFNFVAVWDLHHTNNGIAWNENTDGVYFTWGDRYKGMYLPHEIQQMTFPKHEIMNRLCSFEAGVASNLWRLPEGMVHKILCDSYVL